MPAKIPTTQAVLTAKQLAAEINAHMKKDVVKMGNDPMFVVSFWSTGVLPFDIILQGGMPRGRHVEIYGPYSSLKSLIAYHSIASVQRQGGTALLIDSENVYEDEWGERIGINNTDLLIERPETGQEAFDVMELAARKGVDLIVVDSVTTLLPQEQRDEPLSDTKTQPGRLAALMSLGLRKLTAANKHTAFLWLNQTRQSIGITFGNPEKATGGMALPFYSSMRIEMRKTGKVTEPLNVWTGDEWKATKSQVAQHYMMALEKSKLSKPSQEIHFIWDLRSAQIDLPTFLVAQGLQNGYVQRAGNSWSTDGVSVVGREKFVAKVAADEEAMAWLDDQTRRAHGLPALTPTSRGRSVRVKSKVGTRRKRLPAS